MFNPFFYSIIKQTIADEFITHKHKHTHRMIIAQLRTSSIDLFKREKWTFAQNQKFTYSYVPHSHTVLMKLCPCGRYRQLNSVLYCINHILKSSRQVSLIRFLVLACNLKVGCLFFKTQHRFLH